ncbi:MAG TPA: superoxide dismutase, partial [Candidatus Tripitaka sp. YC43]
MPYQVRPLPFTRELAGISKKTLDIHHGKLYTGYVNKSNEIEDKIKKADKASA